MSACARTRPWADPTPLLSPPTWREDPPLPPPSLSLSPPRYSTLEDMLSEKALRAARAHIEQNQLFGPPTVHTERYLFLPAPPTCLSDV